MEVFWMPGAISKVKNKSQLQEIKSPNLTYFTITILGQWPYARTFTRTRLKKMAGRKAYQGR